jgi:hypothetical protein
MFCSNTQKRYPRFPEEEEEEELLFGVPLSLSRRRRVRCVKIAERSVSSRLARATTSQGYFPALRNVLSASVSLSL